jgi:hypothetical protein
MNYKHLAVALAFLAITTLSLSACSKTKKSSSAGGGASSQSVLTFKGAAR